MKRILTATALTTVMATSALAMTEADEVRIERFLPNYDVSMADEMTIEQLLSIANGGGSFSEKQLQMRSLAMKDDGAVKSFTDEDLKRVYVVVPEDQVANLTDAQKEDAIRIVDTYESRAEAEARLNAIILDAPMNFGTNAVTEGEAALINFYAPEVDVSALSQDEVETILSLIYSEDSVAEIESGISSIVQS